MFRTRGTQWFPQRDGKDVLPRAVKPPGVNGDVQQEGDQLEEVRVDSEKEKGNVSSAKPLTPIKSRFSSPNSSVTRACRSLRKYLPGKTFTLDLSTPITSTPAPSNNPQMSLPMDESVTIELTDDLFLTDDTDLANHPSLNSPTSEHSQVILISACGRFVTFRNKNTSKVITLICDTGCTFNSLWHIS